MQSCLNSTHSRGTTASRAIRGAEKLATGQGPPLSPGGGGRPHFLGYGHMETDETTYLTILDRKNSKFTHFLFPISLILVVYVRKDHIPRVPTALGPISPLLNDILADLKDGKGAKVEFYVDID